MKTKIAFCLPSLHIPGGMERVVTLKANYLAEQSGYEIYMILTDGKNEVPWFKLSSQVKIIHLDINFDELWHLPLHKKIFTYLRKQWIYKRRLRNRLIEIHPDITISTMRREINFICNIKDGSQKIGEIHVNRQNFRNFNSEHSGWIKKILQKLWMNQLIRKIKQLDQFVVLCEEDRKQYPELQNITVISNPLPFYPTDTANCSSKNIIAVGRYEPQKGFDLLLQAWAIVHSRYPDYTLNIYGAGDSSPYVRQAELLNLSSSCQLNGPTDKIVEKYQESAIFVLSSRYEGFGMVVAEAMACGVPPISFACPCGPKDIIRDGEDGLLVENGNTKELAEKICYLIEHDEERKQMGRQARANVQRFSIKNIGKQWETLFEDVLKNKK